MRQFHGVAASSWRRSTVRSGLETEGIRVSYVRSFPDPVQPVLTQRHHAWLSLGLALFVIYGSLLPFDYQPLPWEETLARFRDTCSAPVLVGSRSDWLANVVLFVPLGYLLMGALCVDRSGRGPLAALAVLPCCLCLSVFVEFAQLWFPPRVASLNDIVAQAIGTVLGVLLWLAAGQRLTEWFRGVWAAVGRGGLAARLLPGYLALLGLLNGMPFDLTLSPADLYHKYRDGRIRLVPFASYGDEIYPALEKQCWNVALLLPLGLLLAGLPGGGCRTGHAWRRILALAVAANLMIQVLKLFVMSRFVDATSVVTGTVAVLAGWGLALVLRRDGVPSRFAPAAQERASRGPRKELLGLLLLLWMVAALFVNWQPFNFRLDSSWASAVRRSVPGALRGLLPGRLLEQLRPGRQKTLAVPASGRAPDPRFAPGPPAPGLGSRGPAGGRDGGRHRGRATVSAHAVRQHHGHSCRKLRSLDWRGDRAAHQLPAARNAGRLTRRSVEDPFEEPTFPSFGPGRKAGISLVSIVI